MVVGWQAVPLLPREQLPLVPQRRRLLWNGLMPESDRPTRRYERCEYMWQIPTWSVRILRHVRRDPPRNTSGAESWPCQLPKRSGRRAIAVLNPTEQDTGELQASGLSGSSSGTSRDDVERQPPSPFSSEWITRPVGIGDSSCFCAKR